MRIFKSLLVALIGLTALMYALQNLASIGGLGRQIEAERPGANSAEHPHLLFSNTPDASWMGFALITFRFLS